MHDAYSIPYRKAHEHTDTPDFTDKVFNYIMVSICPVKLTKPLLTFFSDDRDFHTVEPDLAVGSPALGFMYPVLDDGGADGLDANLIADQKRFEIETENVTINVDSGRSDLVEVKRVDGRRAITIWVEGDITVNGIEVDV